MLRYKVLKDKRGAELGETLTWIVATLIIIGILLVFIFFSVLMARVKAIAMENIKTDLPKESAMLTMKTSLAHNLTNGKDKEIIDNILKKDDK